MTEARPSSRTARRRRVGPPRRRRRRCAVRVPGAGGHRRGPLRRDRDAPPAAGHVERRRRADARAARLAAEPSGSISRTRAAVPSPGTGTAHYTPDGDGAFDIGNTTSAALARLEAGTPAADAGPTGDARQRQRLADADPAARARRTRRRRCDAGRPCAHRASRVTHGHEPGPGRLRAVRRSSPARLLSRELDRADALADARGRLPRPATTVDPDAPRGARPPRRVRRARRPRRRLGQLLVRLGRLRGGRLLPRDHRARRPLRQRHRHDRGDRRRAGGHPLGHRRHPVRLAARDARARGRRAARRSAPRPQLAIDEPPIERARVDEVDLQQVPGRRPCPGASA